MIGDVVKMKKNGKLFHKIKTVEETREILKV